MPTQTTPDSGAIPLTPEDVAHLADATGELPDDTATRLQTLIRCADLEQVERTWRLIGTHLKALGQMAEDAGVDLLVDAVFAFHLFERLRSEPWESPEDLLHPGVEMPYQQLISMAGALAERAAGAEKEELGHLRERLIVALGEQLGRERFVQLLIDRLLEIQEEVAESALGHLVGLYRQRRQAAGGE